MKNLNELVVVNAEANLEHGFFFVEFENGKSLQCYLVAASNLDDGYLEQVHIWNNGFDEGLSYYCNEWAKDEDGEMGHINDYLVNKARENGLQIVA